MAPDREPFWRIKPLGAMTPEEWESLCDRCGLCCLHKLEDEETGDLYYTNVACRLLDAQSCQCRHYDQRAHLVPDCLLLSPQQPELFQWLPSTCAYRLVAEGKGLAWWHPLRSGDPETVHQAGISVRGRIVSEDCVPAEQLVDYIVLWPEGSKACHG